MDADELKLHLKTKFGWTEDRFGHLHKTVKKGSARIVFKDRVLRFEKPVIVPATLYSKKEKSGF